MRDAQSLDIVQVQHCNDAIQYIEVKKIHAHMHSLTQPEARHTHALSHTSTGKTHTCILSHKHRQYTHMHTRNSHTFICKHLVPNPA